MDILMTLFILLHAALGGGQQEDANLSKIWNAAQQMAQHGTPVVTVPIVHEGQTPAEETSGESSSDQAADPQKDSAPKVKGIYVSAYSAGGA